MVRALFFLTLLASSIASAQVYRTTDSNGNVIFTDKPPPGGAEEVKLNPTNTTPGTEMRAAPEPVAEDDEEESDEEIEYSIRISAPADGSTIPMGIGSFRVIAAVSPSLEEGETLQLIMNGSNHGEPQTQNSWALENARRGEHSIVVARYNSDGDVLATSEESRILVLRPIGAR